MSWMQFLSWMMCIYAFYYSGLIIYELSRWRDAGAGSKTDQVFVSFDLISPEKVSLQEIEDEEIDYFLGEEEMEEPPIVFSGGVSIRELFALARCESIEYTSAVAF